MHFRSSGVYDPAMTDQDPLREERQAAALRKVADLAQRRAHLIAEADALLGPLGDAVGEAARLGAPRRRTQDLAGVGTALFYSWLEAAGLPVRRKRKDTR